MNWKSIKEKRGKYFSLVEKFDAQSGYFSVSRENPARVKWYTPSGVGIRPFYKILKFCFESNKFDDDFKLYPIGH